jgi:hypothetical protein
MEEATAKRVVWEWAWEAMAEAMEEAMAKRAVWEWAWEAEWVWEVMEVVTVDPKVRMIPEEAWEWDPAVVWEWAPVAWEVRGGHCPRHFRELSTSSYGSSTIELRRGRPIDIGFVCACMIQTSLNSRQADLRASILRMPHSREFNNYGKL